MLVVLPAPRPRTPRVAGRRVAPIVASRGAVGPPATQTCRRPSPFTSERRAAPAGRSRTASRRPGRARTRRTPAGIGTTPATCGHPSASPKTAAPIPDSTRRARIPPGTGRRGASAAAIRGAPATTARSAAKVGPVAQARPNVIRRDAGRPEQHRREDRAERAEGPRPGARRRVLLDGPEPRLDVVTLGRAPPRLAEGNGHVSGGVTPGRPPQGWSGRPAPGRRARVIPAMRPDRPVRRAGRGSPDAPHARRRDGRRARARRATAQDRPARSGLAVADARPSGAPPLSSARGGVRGGAGGCGGRGGCGAADAAPPGGQSRPRRPSWRVRASSPSRSRRSTTEPKRESSSAVVTAASPSSSRDWKASTICGRIRSK